MTALAVPRLDNAAAEATHIPVEPLPVRRVAWSQVRPMTWLWDRRVPEGKLSLLVAEEGGGKGTLEAYLIARVARGELPGGRAGQPVRTLIIGDEDGFEETWVPRLYAAGLSEAEIEAQILTVAPELSLVQDSGRLAETVRKEHIGWVIFDQLLDHIDAGRDGSGIYNAKHVRDALKPLRDVARDTGIAVTGNLHPVKGSPKTFRDLIGGSHQFNAVARSSLWLGQDPDADDREARVLVRGKGNNSAEPPSFDFRITSSGSFQLQGRWYDQPVVRDAREGDRYRSDFEGRRGAAFGQRQTKPAAQLHGEVLVEHLSDEPQGATVLEQRSGVPRNRVYDAARWLVAQGRAEKVGSGWRLPSTAEVELS